MMNLKWSVVLVSFFAITLGVDPVLQIKNGKIRGRTQTMFDGGSYYAFHDIPYAAPPTGKLRFQAPTAAKHWTGILDATAQKTICYQVKIDSPMENEDCLKLDVYIPTYALNNKSSALPVLFWIYGGAFRGGSTGFSSTGPDWFIQQDLIVVSANYRIGPMGFLSTGDLVVPGNAGLKDQQFALKWTQNNIAAFGGDPSKVTIVGESAGSASVGYQLLSPGNAGFFRGAIAQSGSPLNSWAYVTNPKAYVVDLIKILDPKTTFTYDTSSTTLLKYLQGLDVKKIDNASKPANIRLTLPVVEPEHEEAFITQSMYEAFEQGNFNQVPTIIGCNSEEELVMAQSTKYVHVQSRAFDSDNKLLIPQNFNTKTNLATIAQDIKKIYVPLDSKFDIYLNGTIRYYSDNGFTRGIIKQSELMSKFTNVYFYELSYDGKLGNWNKDVGPGTEKVVHGEDLRYLWVFRSRSGNEDLSKFPAADVLTHERMVRLWSNFIKYGNPTPNTKDKLLQNLVWPKMEASHHPYLNINESLEIKTNPKESYAKWVDVYNKYAEKPYVTY